MQILTSLQNSKKKSFNSSETNEEFHWFEATWFAKRKLIYQSFQNKSETEYETL